MARLWIGFAAVFCFAFVGCAESKSPPGGPGAKRVVTSARDQGAHATNVPVNKPATFKIEAPGSATLKQGEQKKETITIDRGKELKEDITVKVATEAKGVTVTPAAHTIKASDADTKFDVTVVAAADAAIGKHDVDVSATTGEGPATSTKFTVEVKGK
jgi:hypothetical protein